MGECGNVNIEYSGDFAPGAKYIQVSMYGAYSVEGPGCVVKTLSGVGVGFACVSLPLPVRLIIEQPSLLLADMLHFNLDVYGRLPDHLSPPSVPVMLASNHPGLMLSFLVRACCGT